MAHLAWVTHGDPGTRMLILHKIHIIVPLHAILAGKLQVEQFVSVDSGVSKVETRGEILLRGERKRHETTILHGQIGGIDALVGVSKLIRHGVTRM